MAELTIHFDLRLGPGFARLAIIFLLLSGMAGELSSSENVTLTTYYPAPAGIYNNLITTQQTILARDSGNVGIGTGTTSPQMALHVVGGGGFTGGFNGMGNTYANRGLTGGGVELGYDQTNNIGDLAVLTEGTAWRAMNYQAASHNFYLGGSGTASMVLTGGKLGIGQTTPATTLDVDGSVTLELGDPSAVLCLTAARVIGHCTAAASCTGTCTCTCTPN